MKIAELADLLEQIYATYPRAERLTPAQLAAWADQVADIDAADASHALRGWCQREIWAPSSPAQLRRAVADWRTGERRRREARAHHGDDRASPARHRAGVSLCMELATGETKIPPDMGRGARFARWVFAEMDRREAGADGVKEGKK